MHEDAHAHAPAYAHQPCSWHNRAVEDRLDDGSSSTGYALSDEPVSYYHWLGADGVSDEMRRNAAREILNWYYCKEVDQLPALGTYRDG